jgi:hypothetical protein
MVTRYGISVSQMDMFIVWFGLGLWFNATFNNISVVSCRSVLLVEETGENPDL